MSQYLSRLPILVGLFFLFAINGFPQQKQSKWFYLATSVENWKFYYQKEIQKLENGNPAFWLKVVYADQSSIEMFQEWDCSQKRYRRLQATVFSPTNEMLDGDEASNWIYVSPDSISLSSFWIVCEQLTETKIVEIIMLQANLRSFPNKNATILRTVKKGDKFTLSLGKPFSGWYNIVDDQTQQDYWIHGNTIKIIEKDADKKAMRKEKANNRKTNDK